MKTDIIYITISCSSLQVFIYFLVWINNIYLEGFYDWTSLELSAKIKVLLVNFWFLYYKVVQIWPGLILCKQVTVCPGHIWTTLYFV
jgi:hypothetical protein